MVWNMRANRDQQPKNLAEQLEQHFTHLQHSRMRDVPILNPAMRVQAVGFHRHPQGYLGILITPWFINLVLLPYDDDDWQDLAIGANRIHVFPSGSDDFIIVEEALIGRFQACSLLSPVNEISDQGAAVKVARAAMSALYDGEARDVDTPTHATEIERRWHGESATETPAQGVTDDSGDIDPPSGVIAEAPLSRPDFSRGQFAKTLESDE